MKLLITDCDTRKAFDVFNILKNHYEEDQIILASDELRIIKHHLIFHNSKVYILRNHLNTFFENDLNHIIDQYYNEDIIFYPLEENTIVKFISFVSKNGNRNLKYKLPDFNNFELARNKYLLNKFCLENDVPAPSLIESNQINSIYASFYPLIIKPRIGSGTIGFIHIDNIKQMDKLNTNKINLEDYVIQEKLPSGKDVRGAFFLCNNGQTISYYCHKRIRTYPLQGGVSVFSKIEDNDEIIKIGRKLLEKLNWSGFAMIEFLWDPKLKKFKVIEINPRLWGSIMLSEFAGTNFLVNYLKLCIDQIPSVAKMNWESKIRWFPFDLLNYFYSRGEIKNFWHLDRKNTCYINCTYSSFFSSFWFHLFYYFKLSNLKTFYKKWRK